MLNPPSGRVATRILFPRLATPPFPASIASSQNAFSVDRGQQAVLSPCRPRRSFPPSADHPDRFTFSSLARFVRQHYFDPAGKNGECPLRSACACPPWRPARWRRLFPFSRPLVGEVVAFPRRRLDRAEAAGLSLRLCEVLFFDPIESRRAPLGETRARPLTSPSLRPRPILFFFFNSP